MRNLQAVNDEMELFSVRGDGLTTATADKTSVSAFVAKASVTEYVGTVMEVQATNSTGENFYLFKVRARLFGILLGVRREEGAWWALCWV